MNNSYDFIFFYNDPIMCFEKEFDKKDFKVEAVDQMDNDDYVNFKEDIPIENIDIKVNNDINGFVEVINAIEDDKVYKTTDKSQFPIITVENNSDIILKSDRKIKNIKKLDSKNNLDVNVKKIKHKRAKSKNNRRVKEKVNNSHEEFGEKFESVMLTDEEITHIREGKRNQPNFKKIPYKCDSCVLGFLRKENYDTHLVKKHNEVCIILYLGPVSQKSTLIYLQNQMFRVFVS